MARVCVGDRSFSSLVVDGGGVGVVGVGRWRRDSLLRRWWWRDDSLRLHPRCILSLNFFLKILLHTTKVATFFMQSILICGKVTIFIEICGKVTIFIESYRKVTIFITIFGKVKIFRWCGMLVGQQQCGCCGK